MTREAIDVERHQSQQRAIEGLTKAIAAVRRMPLDMEVYRAGSDGYGRAEVHIDWTSFRRHHPAEQVREVNGVLHSICHDDRCNTVACHPKEEADHAAALAEQTTGVRT